MIHSNNLKVNIGRLENLIQETTGKYDSEKFNNADESLKGSEDLVIYQQEIRSNDILLSHLKKAMEEITQLQEGSMASKIIEIRKEERKNYYAKIRAFCIKNNCLPSYAQQVIDRPSHLTQNQQRENL